MKEANMRWDDITVHSVAEVNADLGEGPRWDARSNTLLFVDISPGVIYRLDPTNGVLNQLPVGQEVGAAIPRAAGGLVVAMRDGIGSLADGGQDVEIFAPIESHNPGNRMNDAKCDPQGRLWVGTMAFDFQAGAASLYRIDKERSVTRVLQDLTIANGLGWSPDGSTMYFIDSMNYGVDAYRFDGTTGEICEPRRLITIGSEEGMPDGLTVDAQGGIWVALFGGSEVRRYYPDGTLSGRIKLPVTQVTSVCFGGANLDALFITSAAYRLDKAAMKQQPLAGSVFVCSPGMSGQPTTPYAG
jgi:sugar lactone lactonase YvrE